MSPPVRQMLQQGLSLHQQGQLAAAIRQYDAVLALDPHDVDALHLKGLALHHGGRHAEALGLLTKAIRRNAGFAPAYNNRGLAHHSLGKLHEALADFTKAISLKPDFAEALCNKANVLRETGQAAEAAQACLAAIKLNPAVPDFHNSLGVILKDQASWQRALLCFERALALNPNHADACLNRANALKELGRREEALAVFDKAVALRPAQTEAHANRGIVLQELNRTEEALASFDHAMALNPRAAFLPGNRLFARMRLCDWTDFDAELRSILPQLAAGKPVISPWHGLAMTDDPALQLKAAEATAARFPRPAAPPALPAPGDRIRIGYYSSDFRSHALSFLTAELFESHDRSRFDCHAFAFGPPAKDAMRARIEAAFPQFHDVSAKTDTEIVEHSRQLGIDIAVDLNGYTQNARTGIFARRCAAIQVSFLGFPGTMGAGFIDYIIADRMVVPDVQRQDYAEKVVHLPGSFQPNDSRRAISDRRFTRAELGLPEHGVVFCCFNHSYKILPGMFSAWMHILAAVDGAVLWLLADDLAAERNLRREAAARGLDPARLVFGGRLAPKEYRARFRLADLFLDTLPFNGGTTASDALWAGLPVLTCAGRSFAGRMAASLLTALGMEELIVPDLAAYQQRAIAFATDSAQRAAMKERLARNRLSGDLFDGRAFAPKLERAYEQMIGRRLKGLPPDHITVS